MDEKELGKLRKAELVVLCLNQEKELAGLRESAGLLAACRTIHFSHGVEILVREESSEDSPLRVTQALGALTEKFLEMFPQNVKALRKYLFKLDRLEEDREKSREERIAAANAELVESGVDPVVAPGFDSLVPEDADEDESEDEVVEVRPKSRGKFTRVKRG